jgi:23S rRNA maturation-related 3'-5' exoribonuclease YhaM
MSNLIYGSGGVAGHQGVQGQAGYMTDWKEDMMKKYPRFTIKTEYDPMTFAPTNKIIDKRTNKEYKLTLTSISDIMNETDLFIQQLIVTIRDKKINDIINGH